MAMQTQKQTSVGCNNHQTPPPAAAATIRSSGNEEQTPSSNIFMQEDEIAYWLHYPLDDNSLQTYLSTNDLLYSIQPFSAPPPPPSVGPPVPSSSSKVTPEVRSSTIVASNVTPPPPPAHTLESRVSRVSDKPAPVSTSGVGAGAGAGTGTGRDIETCEMSVSVTSSLGNSGSGESSGMEPSTEKASAEKPAPRIDDRKRKVRYVDGDDAETVKDVEFGYHENKQSHGGSTSTKRPRSAEIHNLSERRRRDRINEKMKALQELIPRCNKTDKASMLEEAIEYLKSLQMQVNMMSMGCSMAPMMFLGVQPHMPPMGIGMGVGTGMNHAMFPYPVIPPGQPLPNPAVVAATAAAHLSPSFPAPGFNMTPIPVAGPTPNLMNSLTLNSQNQPHVLGFADRFQRYHGPHQTQLPLPQNQGGMSPIAAKLSSSSKDATNPDIITKPVE